MKLYDFRADWCGPCKMMDPIIDEIDDAYPTLEIVRINIDEQPEVASEYKIQAIPHYILFDENGEAVKAIHGAMPKYKFLQELGL